MYDIEQSPIAHAVKIIGEVNENEFIAMSGM